MADENEPLLAENVELVGGAADVTAATATMDFTVKSSVFGNAEGRVTFAWLLFTSLYWTIIIWIPTLKEMSFATEGLVVWCFACIGMISCSYTLYEGKYPSGATSTDPFEISGIGRYTAAILITVIIADMCALMFILSANDFLYEYNVTRLFFHSVSVFWASLFFFNKFYRYHSWMAIKAFFMEWADIIWTIIVSYTLREFSLDEGDEMTAVHWTYFSFVFIELCGWMFPMMLIKNWGAQKYAQTVSFHLLILDLATDVPVIIVVFAYEAYKDSTLVFIDVIWKSFLLIRSISYYLVNQMLYRTGAREKEQEEEAGNGLLAMATLLWVAFVSLYWTVLTLTALISENEIATQYQYYTWFAGMIGVVCVYDTWMVGYYATTTRGRSMMAFSCTFICSDWMLHSFAILYWGDATWPVLLCMAFHAVAILWALIFFYGDALKRGLWIASFSLAWEWIDIMLMYIVIIILHSELETCFSQTICNGYFVIASLKLYLWFFPIMFGYAGTEWYIHAHMVILDTFTDLPLLIILIATEGYKVHWLLFFDVVYKLIILLRCYAYHGLINLVLKRVELKEKHDSQLPDR